MTRTGGVCSKTNRTPIPKTFNTWNFKVVRGFESMTLNAMDQEVHTISCKTLGATQFKLPKYI